MDRHQLINDLVKSASAFLEISNEELATNYKDSGGTKISVAPIIDKINQFKQVCALVNYSSLSELPEIKLQEFNRRYRRIADAIVKINNYRVKETESPEVQRRSLSMYFMEDRNFNDDWDICWSTVVQGMSVLNVKSHENQINRLNEIVGAAEELHNRLTKILADAQNELSKTGVSKHAGIFREQAEIHHLQAGLWRNRSIGLICGNAVLIGILYISLICASEEKKIPIGVASILLISLLAYCIVLSVKNYFSERHNEVINRHKANCLSSYNTFIDGAPPEVQATILQYTTQTIFSPYNPGFLNKDQLQSPLPIIELMRNITPNKSS